MTEFGGEGKGTDNVWEALKGYQNLWKTEYRIFPRWDRGFSSIVVEHPQNIDFDKFFSEKKASLSTMVPGDIFYYDGHIAIIRHVEVDAEGKVEDVFLIEATYGKWGDGVVSRTNLRSLSYQAKLYYIVRLIRGK